MPSAAEDFCDRSTLIGLSNEDSTKSLSSISLQKIATSTPLIYGNVDEIHVVICR